MTTWILLRGLAREARHWGRVLPLLQQQLPPGDRVLALDLPGSGTRWRERAPATLGGVVEALRPLASVREPQSCVLVALSLGGMVALEWAARHPEEVRGCVLVNSSAGGLAPFWRRLRPRSYAALLQLLLFAAAPRAREQAILRLTSNLPVQHALLEAWAGYAEDAPSARANVLRQLLAAARFRPPRQGPWVPTLLLASARDRLVAPDCSRAMARAWAAPLREHPFAGHDLALDDPEWLVAEAIAWYAGLAPGGPGTGSCHRDATNPP